MIGDHKMQRAAICNYWHELQLNYTRTVSWTNKVIITMRNAIRARKNIPK